MPKEEKQENSEKKVAGEDGVAEERPGVLPGQEILDLELVDPIGKEIGEECLKTASCDLRLGSEVFICGQRKPEFRKLKDGEPVTIESFESIVFSTRENIVLEDRTNIVGRFDLRIRLGLSGLILQVGTQVEPGYKGPLFGLLINTQGTSKTLYEGERFLKIEFSRMSKEPEKKLFDSDKKEIKDLKAFLRKQGIDCDRLAEQSVIQKFRNELKDYKEQHKIKMEQNDRSVIKKGVNYTAYGVLIMILIGMCNIYISCQQNKTYEKLSAVINSTFDENKGSKIPTIIIQEGNGTSKTNKTNSDVVTDSNDVLQMDGNKAGNDSNKNSQETDFDDIGKDKI